MRAYTSVLARVEPTMTFAPATDEPEDRAGADVASRIVQVIEQEVNVRMVRQKLAPTSSYCSTAWIEVGYDPDPRWGEVFIPHEHCLECGDVSAPSQDGTCPECQGQTRVPAMDEQGQPIGEQQPIGKMFYKVRSPFEMYFDLTVPWEEQRELIDETSMSLDAMKDRWPDIADQITPNSLSGSGEHYLDILSVLSGARNEIGRSAMTVPFGRTALGTADRVTETRYWRLPNKQWPKGLLAIVVGQNTVAHVGPLPYGKLGPNGSRIPFLPFFEFPQLLMPVSGMSKTPADDIRAKATQRNIWESLFQLIAQRTSNPVWLNPKGSGIERFTGIPGEILEYNPFGPSPAKPERIPGQGIPAGLLNFFIQCIDHDFEDLASIYDVLRGERPTGVSAGVTIQMLQERANSRFGNMFIQWEDGWCKVTAAAVEIFRQFVTEARMLKIKGKNGMWEVKKFLGSDMSGRVDISAEAGSSVPQTTMAQRADMEQMRNLQIIDPVGDPKMRLKALELFGHKDWAPDFAADSKNAIMENEAFEQIAADQNAAQIIAQVQQQIEQAEQMAAQQGFRDAHVPYPIIVKALGQQGLVVPEVRPVIDGHPTHILEHLDCAKSETALHWPKPVIWLFEQKIAAHKEYDAANRSTPPPRVNVNLKGDLAPNIAAQLAGAPSPEPQAPQDQSTGLLSTPGAVTHVTGGPEAANQEGQFGEMQGQQ